MLSKLGQTMKWLGGAPRRCGACLFKLDAKTKPLRTDLGEDWERAFWTSDTHFVTRENLDKSARRGCGVCRRIIAFLEQSKLECTAIEWHPSRGYGGGMDMRPQLICHLGPEGLLLEMMELCILPEHFDPRGSSVHPSISPGRRISGSTGGAGSLNQVAKWLAECRDKHAKCQRRVSDFVPSRLIDIRESGSDAATVFLVEDLAPPTVYAALSHRWSHETEITRLESAIFDRRKQQGMPLSELPHMMRDAIAVLRRIGIDFVWIDSLCIVQDDENDWCSEAVMMGDIYSNAELVVAATSCRGSGQSLFSSRDGAEFAATDLVGAEAVDEGRQQPLFLRRSVPHFQWKSAGAIGDDSGREWWPLLSRGWVYQEQWLARRTLHFTGHELVWVCNETTACECAWYQFGVVNQIASSGGQLDVRSTTWAAVVEEYSERAFTKFTDRLPALAGIAMRYAESRPDAAGHYLCGIWSERLTEMLAWRSTAKIAPARRLDMRMPTWSWAAVAESVQFEGLGSDKDMIEAIEFRVRYRGSSHYMGDVDEATLILSGRMVQATLLHGQRHPDGSEDAAAQVDDKSVVYRVEVQGRQAPLILDCLIDDEDGSSVSCLLLGSTSMAQRDPDNPETNREGSFANGLVLRCINPETDSYERIGWFGTNDWDDSLGWDMMLGLSQKKQFGFA